MVIFGKIRKDEKIVYVKGDVLCTAFSYAWYCQAMEEITGFSMKNSSSEAGLGWRFFNGSRTQEEEPIFTNNN